MIFSASTYMVPKYLVIRRDFCTALRMRSKFGIISNNFIYINNISTLFTSHFDQVTLYPLHLQPPASGGSLPVALSVQHLDAAHRADPLLVGAGLAIVGAYLMYFLLK